VFVNDKAALVIKQSVEDIGRLVSGWVDSSGPGEVLDLTKGARRRCANETGS
jgi:hypothetical protein